MFCNFHCLPLPAFLIYNSLHENWIAWMLDNTCIKKIPWPCTEQIISQMTLRLWMNLLHPATNVVSSWMLTCLYLMMHKVNTECCFGQLRFSRLGSIEMLNVLSLLLMHLYEYSRFAHCKLSLEKSVCLKYADRIQCFGNTLASIVTTHTKYSRITPILNTSTDLQYTITLVS